MLSLFVLFLVYFDLPVFLNLGLQVLDPLDTFCVFYFNSQLTVTFVHLRQVHRAGD